jgi:hypothetical protein
MARFVLLAAALGTLHVASVAGEFLVTYNEAAEMAEFVIKKVPAEDDLNLDPVVVEMVCKNEPIPEIVKRFLQFLKDATAREHHRDVISLAFCETALGLIKHLGKRNPYVKADGRIDQKAAAKLKTYQQTLMEKLEQVKRSTMTTGQHGAAYAPEM